MKRWFKVHSSHREFMYLWTTNNKDELGQLKSFVKSQGDLYRVTKSNRGWTIWDARP